MSERLPPSLVGWVAVRKKDLKMVAVSKVLDDLPKKGHWLLRIEFHPEYFERE